MCDSLATMVNTKLHKFTNSQDLHNNNAKRTRQDHTDYLFTYLTGTLELLDTHPSTMLLDPGGDIVDDEVEFRIWVICE